MRISTKEIRKIWHNIRPETIKAEKLLNGKMNKSGKTIRAALALACVAAALHSHASFTKSVVLDYSYDATQPLQDGTPGGTDVRCQP